MSGFDLKVSPESIVVCAGAQHAILCSLSTLCSRGDKIIAEEIFEEFQELPLFVLKDLETI